MPPESALFASANVQRRSGEWTAIPSQSSSLACSSVVVTAGMDRRGGLSAEAGGLRIAGAAGGETPPAGAEGGGEISAAAGMLWVAGTEAGDRSVPEAGAGSAPAGGCWAVDARSPSSTTVSWTCILASHLKLIFTYMLHIQIMRTA
jgi:hypothetical protein